MGSDEATYQLAAIISGDIVGYSRLIGSDETHAVRLVTEYREEIERLVPNHHGRLLDFVGDNFLAHFSSSVAAVECAVEIQRALRLRNASLPEERRMRFRLGIHQADVRIEGGRVFGTGVNVAARLEPLADPGGICISGSVKDQIEGRLDLRTESMGTRSVKNISQPVSVHRVLLEDSPPARSPIRRSLTQGRRGLLVLAGVAGLLVLLVGGYWFTLSSPSRTKPDDLREGAAALPAQASRAGSDTASAAALPALPDKPSIVVLPFINLSDDPEQDFFGDGISEDLTTDLSKVPELFVISRSSAFTYKGKDVDARQIGRELGVRYLLEGSVRKVANRVRITGQLVDTTSGFHIWSERYDREISDIFAIQNEINAKILSALQITIAEAETARIRRAPVEDLSAYEAWYKGRTLIRRLTKHDILEGRRLLERAIELQPSYGEAYAELSNSYLAELHTWNFDRSLGNKAVELARRGLELSPLSPITHTSLALAELGQFRPDNAIALAKRAVELAPSDFSGYSVLGGAYLLMGQVEDAIASLEKAVRLNPVAPDVTYTGLATALYFSNRRDEAAALWERVRAANPEALVDRISLVMYYVEVGKPDRARPIVAEILEEHPGYTAEQAAEMFRDGLRPMTDEDIEQLARDFELVGFP